MPKAGGTGNYVHTMLGFNYRMTNILAAIGLVQLKRQPEFNQCRIAHAAFLSQRF